ncbi:MAG: GTPase Era [Gemmatimonadota bacterium]
MNDALGPSGNPTRAGFVAILGRPNAGKSTLLNALVGEHLAAVSPKVQTTRHRIPGFWTDGDTQIVFVDTPGLLEPGYALQDAMMETARAALDGVDLVYWLVDHDEPSDLEKALLGGLARREIPLFLLLTKADQVPAAKLEARAGRWGSAARWRRAFRIAAPTGEGLDALLEATREVLPEQPFFYPADQLTDLNLRVLAAELVREACYEELGQELPYSVHVAVEEWRDPVEPGEKTAIRATIHVERESQKGIVIGEQGRRLKAVGIRARLGIEALVGGPVYLTLWVKVRKKWSRREADLKHFGYRR